jgi:hypothetical protein
MYIADIVTAVDSQMDNVIDDTPKIKWINELEQMIYSRVIRKTASSEANLVAAQANYALGTIKFSEILHVIVNGAKYERLDLEYHDDKSYYLNGTDIILDPTPSTSVTDGLEIIYLDLPDLKTEGNMATETPSILEEYNYQYVALYEMYMFTEICIWKREFGEANNYGQLFNIKLAEFAAEYELQAPQVVAAERQNVWRCGV